MKIMGPFFLIFFLFLSPACKTAPEPRVTDAAKEQSGESLGGIKVEAIRLTAAGHMVDFRFRVVDPEKADGLLKRQNKAYVIDEKTGMKLSVPSIGKVGSLRQTTLQPETGRIYFILFSNADGLVKPGSRVSIVIGDFKTENLIVE